MTYIAANPQAYMSDERLALFELNTDEMAALCTMTAEAAEEALDEVVYRARSSQARLAAIVAWRRGLQDGTIPRDTRFDEFLLWPQVSTGLTCEVLVPKIHDVYYGMVEEVNSYRSHRADVDRQLAETNARVNGVTHPDDDTDFPVYDPEAYAAMREAEKKRMEEESATDETSDFVDILPRVVSSGSDYDSDDDCEPTFPYRHSEVVEVPGPSLPFAPHSPIEHGPPTPLPDFDFPGFLYADEPSLSGFATPPNRVGEKRAMCPDAPHAKRVRTPILGDLHE